MSESPCDCEDCRRQSNHLREYFGMHGDKDATALTIQQSKTEVPFKQVGFVGYTLTMSKIITDVAFIGASFTQKGESKVFE